MIDILRQILDNKLQRMQLIQQFQDVIWDWDGSGPYFDILSTLAYDLDYYEPDAGFRKESPSFYGDDRLEEEIKQALRQLEQLDKDR